MTSRRRLAVGVLALLVAALRAASAQQLPADVVKDLEREVAPRSEARCPEPGTYSLDRPDAAGTPTVVGVGVFFQDVAALSDVDQSAEADLYVVERWRDPRLANPARTETSAECPLPEGRLWMPALEAESLRNRQAFYPAHFLVDGRGVVTWVRRLWVKVSYPLDFRDFPLDRHRWMLSLWPVLSRADEMVLHPLRRVTAMNDHLSIQGWRVDAPRATTSTAPRIARAGTFARFDVELDLTRDWTYHAWKLGLPLTLIVLMAYGVYFLPPSALSQQIGLGMTSMLTLIAYMLTLGSTLPHIAYLTRADRFFVGSAILVFVGLVKAIVTTVLAQSPAAHIVERADRWGRRIYPLAMLANFALAFLT
jgi:Neurotransmitter-gated ion-channel ligand binding domain/Neurotransmitter-gated ion-channel transmembrane region